MVEKTCPACSQASREYAGQIFSGPLLTIFLFSSPKHANKPDSARHKQYKPDSFPRVYTGVVGASLADVV